jgi:hypothetical protein
MVFSFVFMYIGNEVAKICHLALPCLSVCLHITTSEPLNVFLLNLISESFMLYVMVKTRP